MPIQSLIKCIVQHEGCKRYAYKDTKGYTTIGCGRNIDSRCDNGLSEQEIMYLLNNDIMAMHNQLIKFTWYTIQDEVRREALIELCFNMGLETFLEFKNTIHYLQNKYYQDACKELQNSKWATEVSKDRVQDICYRILNARYQG